MISKDYLSISNQVPVTPSDTTDLGQITDGISLNESGAVTFVCASGQTVTRSLLSGIDYPYKVKRVNATGTDEGLGIHALYF